MIILACTHYPLLDTHFDAVLGSAVARVDPAVEQAGRAAALVASRGIAPGSGHTRYVTTGDVELFHANVSLLMAKHQPNCEAATPGI